MLFACHDHCEAGDQRYLAWAGLTAGLAAWTKNEGLLFLLSLAIARSMLALVRRRVDWRPMLPFALGLLPVAVLLVYFKSQLAPASDIIVGQGVETVTRLTTPARYWEIASAVWSEVVRSGSLMALALLAHVALMGLTRDMTARRACVNVVAVLILVCGGYWLVYVTTPSDLSWQLRTSLPRLFVQLWPSAILGLFLFTASPEELAVSSLRGSKGSTSRAKR